MKWTRITPVGSKDCTTQWCNHSAKWHMEAGGVGSDYCSACRESLIDADVRRAAALVVSYDCSDCDQDYREAVARLRSALDQ